MTKSKLTHWQTFPARLLLFLCTGIGIIFAISVTWNFIFPARMNPTKLSPLPADAIAIHSIGAEGFFEVQPQIQAEDGRIYSWTWESGAYSWEVLPEPMPAAASDPCNSEDIALIESASGALLDCQVVRTVGEWCPGTVASIAVTENGQVWELAQEQPCPFFVGIAAVQLALLGFVVGILIVVLRKVMLIIMKRRTA